MKTFEYTGKITTGNTLDVKGEPLEVMLFPGRRLELPEDDPWVARLIKRGYLKEVPEGRKQPARAKAGAEAKAVAETKAETETRTEAEPKADGGK